MESRYNTRSPAVKRLMREAQELSQPTDQYFAQPLEDNLFEWHFTVRGPSDSDFQNGIYHGRIILPVDYPMKPPSIIWLTPNGRFETNKKICLSISGHHPESWQPSWSIRTALMAIIGFMPSHPNGAIGSLDYTPDERKILAKKSNDWKCPVCGDISKVLLEPNSESIVTEKEAKELATHINFQVEKPKSNDGECFGGNAATCATTCTTATVQTDAQLFSSHLPCSTYVSAASTSPCSQAPVRMFSQWTTAPGVMPSAPSEPPMTMNPNPHLHSTQFQSSPAAGNGISSLPTFPYPPSRYIQCGYSYPFFRPGCSLPPGVGTFPCPSYPRMSSSFANPCCSRYMLRPYCCSTMSPIVTVADAAVMVPSDAGRTQPKNSIDISDEADPHNSTQTDRNSEEKVPVQDATADVRGTTAKAENVSFAEGEKPNETTPKSGDNFGDQNINTSSILADSSTSEDCIAPVKNDSAHKYSLQKDVKTMGAVGLTEESPSSDLFLLNSEKCSPLLAKEKESLNEVDRVELTSSESHKVEEDSSDTGIPQIEVSDTEQRSFFEKSTSSSVPDLEKVRQGAIKGLRHRQSAPGQAITDVSEVSQSSASSELAGARRIEAASGDNPHPQRTSPQGIRIVQLGRGQQRDRENQGYFSVDTSFLLMVVLSVSTALILLNRILHMVDWSEMGSKL